MPGLRRPRRRGRLSGSLAAPKQPSVISAGQRISVEILCRVPNVPLDSAQLRLQSAQLVHAARTAVPVPRPRAV